MTAISPCIFRVRRISESGYHHIMVPSQGHIICSCNGESWCSHIDATLVAGERYMVHKHDRAIADRAQVMAKGRVAPYSQWKAHWRHNRRWRGLPKSETVAEKMIKAGEPVVSIQGAATKRKAAATISLENGWRIHDRPTKGVLVHVSDDAEHRTTKHALKLGIMIVTHDEWESIAPIGQALHARISDLLSQQK